MNAYFGYTRVSTVKQGDGVSLDAQRDAITAYADRHRLRIIAWYEEKETAAKQGRPVFTRMIKTIRAGEADGLIIHKIDRSARNFADWAMIGELLDRGVDVRFAHESLDMSSRGGRLTADIQAVIAADYVRNLREECLKGIEGRLKQGLFPFAAPIGYLDQGAGKPKIHDAERAPYIRQAFELYASQAYSLRGLLAELRRRGLKTRTGRPLSKGCLENLLGNPFYCGKIYIKRTGRTYDGVHDPIVSKALFDQVQALKSDRQHKKRTRHNHTFRRLITCGHCNRSLYGELQKGRVYMRCQTKGCATKAIREDQLDTEIGRALSRVQINEGVQERLERELSAKMKMRSEASDRAVIELQIAKLSQREETLTDALLDQLIDRDTFQKRKDRLVEERADLEARLTEIGTIGADERFARQFLELAKNVTGLYQLADRAKKRRIAEIAFSNRTLTGNQLCLTPQEWLEDAETTLGVLCGAPHRDRTRTEETVQEVWDLFDRQPAPTVSIQKHRKDTLQCKYN